MAISIEELSKAVSSLQRAIEFYHESEKGSEEQKAFRDSALQRFEYSVELSWKTSVKALGSTTAAAKPAVREMARNQLIENPGQWLSFIDARNKTSHSYDENTAQEVFKSTQEFLPEAKKLIERLRALK